MGGGVPLACTRRASEDWNVEHEHRRRSSGSVPNAVKVRATDPIVRCRDKPRARQRACPTCSLDIQLRLRHFWLPPRPSPTISCVSGVGGALGTVDLLVFCVFALELAASKMFGSTPSITSFAFTSLLGCKEVVTLGVNSRIGNPC